MNFLRPFSKGFHSSEGPVTASRPKYNPIKKVTIAEAALNEGYNFVDPNAAEQIGKYSSLTISLSSFVYYY